MSDSRILSNLNKSSSATSTNSNAATSSINQSQNFSSLMQKNSDVQDSNKMISPFDLAQNGGKLNPGIPNQNTVLAQIQLAQNTMSTIQEQVSYPNLKLRSSQKHLIKSKLSSANNSLQLAHTKLDKTLVEQERDAAGQPSKGKAAISQEDTSIQPKGPASTLFDYIVSGLNEMDAVKSLVGDLAKREGNLNPADFLVVQIKLAKAQQELEFTSGLLSKVVEDFKMIMNIQL